MSDDVTKTESETTAADKPSQPAPRRSPVERALVWGLIGIMLVIVGIEGRARLGYWLSLRALQNRGDAIDEGTADEMRLSDVRRMVRGGLFKARPTEEIVRENFEDRIIFTWHGLLKTQGTVHLGREIDPPLPDEPLKDPLVWIVRQPGTPEPVAEAQEPGEPGAEGGPGMAGMRPPGGPEGPGMGHGGPGMGGPGGGRPPGGPGVPSGSPDDSAVEAPAPSGNASSDEEDEAD